MLRACSDHNARSITGWNNLQWNLWNHINKKGGNMPKAPPNVPQVMGRATGTEHVKSCLLCALLCGGQPLVLLAQSQASHSSVYREVAVTSQACFPLSWILSMVPLHNLASSPRNTARWKGNSWGGTLLKIPWDYKSRNPLVQLEETEGTFTKQNGHVRKKEKECKFERHDHITRQKTFVTRLKVLCVF